MEIPRYYPRGGYIDQEQVCPKYIKWGLCVDCSFRLNHARCPYIQHEWELKQKYTPAFFTDRIECSNCQYQLSPQEFLLHLNNLRDYKEINVKVDKIHHTVFIDNCSYCHPVDGWYVGTPNKEIIENSDSPLAIEQARVVNKLLNKNAQAERDDYQEKEKLYRSKWVISSDFNHVDQGAVAKSNSYLEFEESAPVEEKKVEIEEEEFDPLAENIPLGMSPCAKHKQRAASEVCEFCYKSFCRQCIIHFADKILCTNCIDRKEVKQLLVRLGYMTDEYDHKYTESHYTPDSYENNFLMVKRNGDYALPFRKIAATIIDIVIHRFFLVGFMFIVWFILGRLLSFGHISSSLIFIDNAFALPYDQLMIWPFDDWKYYPISAFTLGSESVLVLLALLKYRQTLGMHIMGVIYGNDIGNHNTLPILILTSIFHEINIITFGLISITAIWDKHFRSIPEYLLGTRTLTVWQSVMTDNPLDTVYLTGKKEPPMFQRSTKNQRVSSEEKYTRESEQVKGRKQYYPEIFDSDNPVSPRE